VENFAEEMNATAQRLGMTQSHYVNPNGLPDPGQVTSARDLAILARHLLRDFPQYDLYWHISAIKFGKRVMRNHNRLIDRYRGADGMKTGFICASGFNVVATATRNGRRLIAVVLGAPSTPVRAEKAARLLESGFNSGTSLSWLTPSLGVIDSLQPIEATPPNLYDETCGPHRRRPAAEAEEEEASTSDGAGGESGSALSSLQTPKAPLIGPWVPSMPPIVVSVVSSKGRSKVAAAPPGADAAAAKSQQIAPASVATEAPPLAGAAAIRPATFSTTKLATNPPPSLALRRLDVAVPVPRPRPHARLKKQP
jgi:D-alanyl-D-alanine carboxypeptidase